MNFVPGADWSERGAGTNAPGTALALDRELQILGAPSTSPAWCSPGVAPRSRCTTRPPAPCSARSTSPADQGGLAADAGAGARHRRSPSRTTSPCCGSPVSPPNPPPGRPQLVVLGRERPRWVTTDELRASAGRTPHRPARRHPGAAQPSPRGTVGRPPRRAARRQGPRRRHRARRDVAPAQGRRRRDPRLPALPAAGPRSPATSARCSTRSMPATSTPR